MVKRNHRPQTRWDKAETVLNALATTTVVLNSEHTNHSIILMAVKAWDYLTTGYVTIDHLEAVLDFNRDKILYHLSRLKGLKYVVVEEEFVALTKEGAKETRRLEAARGLLYKRFHDHSKDQILYNFKRNKR